MTDGQLAFSVAKLKQYGIVDSGDSRALGIGAMTDERMRSFFGKMVAAKVAAPNTDYKKAYSLAFVNKKIGLTTGGAVSPAPAPNR
jgi:NitT/TauT family transport system substrate-binding protein